VASASEAHVVVAAQAGLVSSDGQVAPVAASPSLHGDRRAVEVDASAPVIRRIVSTLWTPKVSRLRTRRSLLAGPPLPPPRVWPARGLRRT
jgi:hypothetical protein